MFQLDSFSNKAPLRARGQQLVKVNGKEEVTNCFIQAPSLSAPAAKKRYS